MSNIRLFVNKTKSMRRMSRWNVKFLTCELFLNFSSLSLLSDPSSRLPLGLLLHFLSVSQALRREHTQTVKPLGYSSPSGKPKKGQIKPTDDPLRAEVELTSQLKIKFEIFTAFSWRSHPERRASVKSHVFTYLFPTYLWIKIEFSSVCFGKIFTETSIL